MEEKDFFDMMDEAIQEDLSMYVKEISCYTCKHFIGGTYDTYWEQGEPAECTHERSFICQFNNYFPFINGCKNHEK